MKLCSACAVIDENRFQLVRDFLTANDGAAVSEISRATWVSTPDVRRFLESGRLIDITASATRCTCGGMGERCRFCRSQLAGPFREMQKKMVREQEGDRGAGERTSYVRRMNRLGDTGS